MFEKFLAHLDPHQREKFEHIYDIYAEDLDLDGYNENEALVEIGNLLLNDQIADLEDVAWTTSSLDTAADLDELASCLSLTASIVDEIEKYTGIRCFASAY